MQVGSIVSYTDYRGLAAREAGDLTMVRSVVRVAPPPPAANDNGIVEHPRIIGLMGYAGSGKSAVGRELASYGFVGTKFAGPLKSMIRSLYERAGLPAAEIDRRIEGDLKEQPDDLLLGRTPRQAMQWLGTNWGRDFFGGGFWVGMWAASLLPYARYFVDDCRFENEADAIRSRGGVVVLIKRPGVGPANDHISEALPIEPDIVIHNDGSLADLRSRVREIVS
jgi:hypothetical protein